MSPRSRTLLLLVAIVATFVYLALSLTHARALVFQMNPDGVSYIRIAGYYARGDFSLAVNSYWGPMLSWLLVPTLWLGIAPAVAVKAILIVFGILFALASAALAGRVAGFGAAVATYVAVLFFALPLSMYGVTPDLPMAFFVTLYLALAAPLAHEATARRTFAAGIVGGLAYLTKAYALPFVAAHLIFTFVFRAFLVWRGVAKGRVVVPFVAGVAGLLILALPWVLILSKHDGRPTFGSASRFLRAWDSELEREERGLPIYLLQRPREGRITSWENPMELEGEWPGWEPVGPVDALKRQIKLVVKGLRKTTLYTSELDAFSVILTGAFLAVWLLLMEWRRFPGDADYTRSLWLILSIALYMGGYIIAFVRDRYLWPVDGALIALAVAAFSRIGASAPQDDAPARPRPLFLALSLLLAVSLLLQYVQVAEDLLAPSSRQMAQKWLKERADAVDIEGPVASNKWSSGLYVAFWKDVPYVGSITGKNAAQVRDELAPLSERATVVVFDNPDLESSLASDPRFRRVGGETHAPTGTTFAIFHMQPAETEARN